MSCVLIMCFWLMILSYLHFYDFLLCKTNWNYLNLNSKKSSLIFFKMTAGKFNPDFIKLDKFSTEKFDLILTVKQFTHFFGCQRAVTPRFLYHVCADEYMLINEEWLLLCFLLFVSLCSWTSSCSSEILSPQHLSRTWLWFWSGSHSVTSTAPWWSRFLDTR